MEQPLVVVADAGDAAPSSDFAAGVATATAAQATEDAQAAEATASAAVAVAGSAVDAAEGAAREAEAAADIALTMQEQIDRLEAVVFEGFAAVSDALAAEDGALEALGDDGVTAPEAHGDGGDQGDGEEKPKRERRPKKQRTAFGNSWFFKGRNDRG